MAKRVVILGGGIAGMSTAHELGQRGYQVVVLERSPLPGGKARSIDISESDLGPKPKVEFSDEGTVPWLPGEHGFRFFPGFYKHVIDTMARIPVGDGRSAADNLVPTTRFGISQYGQPVFQLPARFPRTPDDALLLLSDLLLAFSPVTGLTPGDLSHFGARIWQLLSSCDERRLAEYEHIPWWAFMDAGNRSRAYQKFLAQGFTRSLVAAKAETASTRTIGNAFLQLLFTVLDPSAATSDRVLNGPTSEVWIEPWLDLIRSFGVDYRSGTSVMSLRCDDRGIAGVVVDNGGRREVVVGDYYICALPVERMAPLVTAKMVELDPSLASLAQLSQNVEWMSGLQLYLREDVPMAPGHMIHVDTEWALTSISQLQFWAPDALAEYSDREIKGILSVDISDWEIPGIHGRSARQCSRQEVQAEVWEQLKRSVNHGDRPLLRDEDLLGWFLDPDIQPNPRHNGELWNTEALLVNLVDTWQLRPDAQTAIPNMWLASDYVRTHTDIATMEGANEAARRAVNAVLDVDEHPDPRCEIWPLREPPYLQPFRTYDAARFRLGLPWDNSLVDMASAALAAFDSPLRAVIDGVVAAAPAASVAVASARLGPSLAAPASGQPRAPGRTSALAPASTDVGPDGFVDRLDWYARPVRELLGGVLSDRQPGPHLYALISEFVRRPSKGLRPALCLATCSAFGGDQRLGVPSAAGLEMLHNAFLVHDDVEDESELRRGQPTLHRQVGVPLAINAGDAMHSVALRLFRRNVSLLGAESALRIFDEVDHLLAETLEGQAMELGWARSGDTGFGIDDYLRLVLKKTSWYSFIHPMRIGALIARPEDDDLNRFNRFGYLLGAAFQIQDDVLNIAGSIRRYGKEIGGDLVEGKRTLILLHALAHVTTSQRSRMIGFLNRPSREPLPRQMIEILDVLHGTGSVQWASEVATALADAAADAFTVAFGDTQGGPDLAFIASLVDYVTARDL